MLLMLITFAILGLLPLAALAVEVTPKDMSNPWTVWMPLIIGVVPILVMYFKKLLPAKFAPLIPAVAVMFGPLVDYAISYLTGKAADPTAGVMYGGLAVALREVVDQVRRADWSPDSWTPPAAKAGAILLVGLLAAGCASTTVGKAVQAADVQKRLVEAATVEVIKLHMQKRVSDDAYKVVKDAYGQWAAAETVLANALASWKTVKSVENESKLGAALNQVKGLTDPLLTLLGRYVNLDAVKKKLADVGVIYVTHEEAPASWSELESRARLELADIYARAVAR